MHQRFLLLLIIGLCINACLFSTALLASDNDYIEQQGIPFVFIENKGQVTDQHGSPRFDIDARISANGVNVFIGSGQVHYQWARLNNASEISEQTRKRDLKTSSELEMYRMDIKLLGANNDAVLVREAPQGYYEQYYLPHSNGDRVYSYQKLRYKNIYPNIDWILYIRGGKLEYDFVVHPGGRVSDIRLQYGGATTLTVNEDGSLTAVTPQGYVTEQAPHSFDEAGAEVASGFVLEDQVLRFEVADYTGSLTIDPTLSWGTYYGDIGSPFEQTSDVEYDGVNKSGVYICGFTGSATNIATVGAYQVTIGGNNDAFLVKFNDAGERQWGTYFGGADADGQEAKIAADTLGNIYMVSSTSSTSIAMTAGSHQPTYGGGVNDFFLAKFDSLGVLQWSTYYGGEGGESFAEGVTTNGSDIYIAGTTNSNTGIATPGAHQPLLGGSSSSDAFLVKFNSSGVRQWGTYYGGASQESAREVVCDETGYIYLTGNTLSDTGIATSGSYQVARAGGTDAFIVKFDSIGQRIWASYYGGDDHEDIRTIVSDAACNIYLGGSTESTSGIATAGTQQVNIQGGKDMFLLKLDSSGQRQWGTYYGGDEDETYPRITCHGEKLFVGASSLSPTNIATPGAYQSTNNALGTIYGNIWLAEFNTQSGLRNWSTYYGGTGGEFVNGIAYDEQGYLYIGGGTISVSGITTPGSHQDTYVGVFVVPYLARFCVSPAAASIDLSGKDTICARALESYTVAPVEEAEAYIWELPGGWTGASDSNTIELLSGTDGGVVRVRVVRCGDTSAVKDFEVYVLPVDPAIISINGFVLGTAGTYSSYQWLLNGQVINGATASSYTVTENGKYSVVTTNAYGCIDTSEVYEVTNYTGIEGIPSIASHIRVYPNPANDRVHIDAPVPVRVVLVSLDGKALLRSEAGAGSLDISGLAPGMYMLRLFSEAGVILKTEKLLKAR